MKVALAIIFLSIPLICKGQNKIFWSSENILLERSDSAKSYYYFQTHNVKGMKKKEIAEDMKKPVLSFYTNTGTVYYNEVRDPNRSTSVRTYYYPDGNIKFVANFLSGQPTGTIKTFYKNGKLKSELIFEEPVRESDKEQVVGVIHFNDSTGKALVVGGKGVCNCDLNPLTPNGYFETGIVKDGFKIGQWTGRSKDTNSTYSEIYKEGVLTRGVFTSDSISYSYKKILLQPAFPGGLEAMYQFVNRTIQYPASARRASKEGSVYVTFIVDTNGRLIDLDILGDADSDLGGEALRVVSLMPDWIPGRLRGKPFQARFTLPLKFKLN